MLKKEVKRLQWNLPEAQPEQRDVAEYMLGIVEEVEEPVEEPVEETPDGDD